MGARCLRSIPRRESTTGDRLNDELVLEAYAHALRSRPLDDEDDPRRWLVIGLARSGRALELVVLVFDERLRAPHPRHEGAFAVPRGLSPQLPRRRGGAHPPFQSAGLLTRQEAGAVRADGRIQKRCLTRP